MIRFGVLDRMADVERVTAPAHFSCRRNGCGEHHARARGVDPL